MYCGDNPVNMCDPSGKFAITLTTLLIGGLIAWGIMGAFGHKEFDWWSHHS